MKNHCVYHIHHVPKWPSYFCKIWALCVLQLYMVYVLTYLLSVCNTINLSWTCLIRPNDGRRISQKSISHKTSLNILVHDVINLLYIYTYLIFDYILYLISSQTTKSKLEWGQLSLKCLKWNLKWKMKCKKLVKQVIIVTEFLK